MYFVNNTADQNLLIVILPSHNCPYFISVFDTSDENMLVLTEIHKEYSALVSEVQGLTHVLILLLLKNSDIM